MRWELFEVWSTDVDGVEELIDTTKSLKEAKQLARKAINEGSVRTIIYLETADGDYTVVDEQTK